MVARNKQVAVYRPWQLAVNVLGASSLILPSLRMRLYRWGGLQVETRGIRPGCVIHTGKLRVGPDTLIGQRCHLENREMIEIGARCSLAPEVFIATSTHAIGSHERRAGEHTGGPVRIGDGCWIGARAVILPNVTVGAGCVIAAGAVVTEDCEPNGLYVGVPARRARDLEGAAQAVTTG